MEWGRCLFTYIRHLLTFILSLFNLKALLWHLLNIHVTLCIDTVLDSYYFFCPKYICFCKAADEEARTLSFPLYHQPTPLH